MQRLWVEGDRAAAVRSVPDELLLQAYPIGDEAMVRARVQAIADAGIDSVRITPQGRTVSDQIAHLEMAVDLITSATSSG